MYQKLCRKIQGSSGHRLFGSDYYQIYVCGRDRGCWPCSRRSRRPVLEVLVFPPTRMEAWFRPTYAHVCRVNQHICQPSQP